MHISLKDVWREEEAFECYVIPVLRVCSPSKGGAFSAVDVTNPY
jgi:hypothetical protein